MSEEDYTNVLEFGAAHAAETSCLERTVASVFQTASARDERILTFINQQNACMTSSREHTVNSISLFTL